MQANTAIDCTAPAASLKMPMLRKLAAHLQLEVKGDRRYRQTWIDAIEAHRAAAPRTAEQVLEALTLKQLNVLCRQNSVTGYTALTQKKHKVARLLRVCDHASLVSFCETFFAV